MQIELIGCTSAGKSTFAARLLEASRAQQAVVLGEDYILGQARLAGVKPRALRRVLVNLLAAYGLLGAGRSARAILAFAVRLLLPLPIAPGEKLSILRNVLKRVGIDAIVRRRCGDGQIVLLDEGLVQSAHYLFVHETVPVDEQRLQQFAELLPLPDAIIYLRPPEPVLVERTLRRGHRRVRHAAEGGASRFISRAVTVFDRLSGIPAIAHRLVIVDDTQPVQPLLSADDSPGEIASALRLLAGVAGSVR